MNRRNAVKMIALGGVTLSLAGCTDETAEDDSGADDDDDDVSDDTDTESVDDEPLEDDEQVDDEDDEDDEEEEDEESEAGPDDQEFSGSGDEVIEELSIEAGLTIVDATHDGEDDFEVRLVPEEHLEDEDDEDDDDDEDDEETRTLFVETEAEYDGQTARSIDEGTYLLAVTADGDWEVTVQQPRDSSGDSLPLSIEGSGNEVHGPFEFDDSSQPSGSYDGDSIMVHVFAPTADSGEFVFHEDSIDSPSELEFEDVGYLAIESDGDWELEIE